MLPAHCKYCTSPYLDTKLWPAKPCSCGPPLETVEHTCSSSKRNL